MDITTNACHYCAFCRYLYGMYGFGLEETGNYAAAEKTAKLVCYSPYPKPCMGCAVEKCENI